ncbi:MAG: helix-turn-helix domain-containing protein [Turicibacter sanguinis]|uniref:helix-turn-helix domain-containing protein n=1 Tax=Turicibacter TaxID=191303 RepID=UPI00104C6BDE|nr:helix-turn-helix transcriptional regulator [Turicibacter sp.]MTN45721.1 helix-turn-helix domain-containing protein [Turicibacter sanguinis]MTN51502.1 helix-turn-helix domain-containing protein [Turicibacter sanguinis]MTN54700.1 helix-turn-helix domain-containing protein [Turicibacter sanguinis]MTN57783.1 helix-turn-helix domain-containing protein [Turicibacter sanguinis]
MSFNSFLSKYKITGYALSRMTGLSQSTIAAWTSGVRDPMGMSLKNALKICKALNIDLNTLHKELNQKN